MEGTVSEETDRYTSIEAAGGTIKIPRSDIEWVVKGTDEYIEKKAYTGSLFKKSEKLMIEERFGEAASALKEASQLEPASIPIWNNLGTALAKDKQYKNATLAFQQAVQLNPEDKTLLENLANAHTEAAEYREARNIYHKMLKTSNKPGDLYLKLSIVFYKSGLYTQHKKTFFAAKRLGATQALLMRG